MTMKEFDELIKDKLKHYNSTHSTPDWESLSQILDRAQEDNLDTFDKIIAEKLAKKHISTSKAKDWNAFSDTLAGHIKIKNKITSIKLCELLALIFIFIILGWGSKQGSIQYIPVKREMPTLIAKQLDISPEKNQTTETKTQLIKTFLPEKEKLSHIFQFLLNSLNFYNLLPASDTPVETLEDEVIFARFNEATFSNNPVLPTQENKTFLVVSDNQILKEAVIRAPLPQPKQNKLEWSVVPTALMNINIVASPYDPIYKLNGYTRVSSQPAFALLAGARKGGNEILTGVRLKNTSYQPKAVREIFGGIQNAVTSVSLTNVSYQVIEVPLILRKHIINNKDFKVFAGIYAGLNVISKSDYQIDYEDIPSFMPSPPLVVDGSGPQPKLEQKPFSTGWMEGGSFSENAFFTGGVEIGIEKLIANDLSLNIAASFGKYLSNTGKGPNRDSFDDLNLSIGFRKLL